jgi:hypothetical protein
MFVGIFPSPLFIDIVSYSKTIHSFYFFQSHDIDKSCRTFEKFISKMRILSIFAVLKKMQVGILTECIGNVRNKDYLALNKNEYQRVKRLSNLLDRSLISTISIFYEF